MSVTTLCDIPYAGQSERQKMDIYLPEKKGGVDAVLGIHSGGFFMGDKSEVRGALEDYAGRGYAAAGLNYRLINRNLPPEQQPVSYVDLLDYIDNAVIKLKATLFEEGYTPRRLALTGGSAGAHLAMLYAYSRGARCALPIAFVNAGAPPTITRYCGLDEMVPASQGARLKAALDAAGVRNDLFVYPNGDHSGVVRDNEADQLVHAMYTATLREYFDTYLVG